jgi:RNA polymerase sigma-70 factor (ECF subfamily)
LETGVPEESAADNCELNNREGERFDLKRAMRAHTTSLLEYVGNRLPPDLRSFVEPRDVVQDVFFEAVQRAADVKLLGKDSEYYWLLKITRNRLLSLIRTRRASKRGGTRQIDELPNGVNGVMTLLEQWAVYSRTPSQSAMEHELIAKMQNSINRIEPDHREVIQLRYIDGLSAKESAARMGRSEAAIFMLCRRGLDSLKVHLLEAGALAP